MTNKIQKIRQEVEKLKSNLIHGACSSQVAMETRCKEEAYNEVLAILDSMQEEPVSEDLMEATNNYCVNVRKGYPRVMDETDRYICNAFKAGAQWQKEQIMKDATDVTVHIDAGGYPYIPQMELYDYDNDVPLAKEGDKYKVVLIKEE